MQPKSQCGPEDTETIGYGTAEVDRGGFREVFRGAGDLSDREPEGNRLGEHLVVEDEIVGVLVEGKGLQDAAS